MTNRATKIRKGKATELLIVHPNACGIDVSSKEFQVCVPEDRDPRNNRVFGSFTRNLHEIARWLKDCNIETAAMESTGVYWIQLYMLLEEYGIEVILVNAKHIKNICDKKTDVVDASWIQLLHSYGLLKASFQPDHFARKIRNLMRHRESLVRSASREVQHIEKSMEQMNIKLYKVISDVVGSSGKKIIEAILNGQRDPSKLASLSNNRINAPKETIAKSLEGNWNQDQLFILKQSYNLYNYYNEKIKECDIEVEKMLESYTLENNQMKEFSITKKPSRKKNELHFDAEKYVMQIFGVNICKIEGISWLSAIKLASELGIGFTDKFKTYKHFCSWINVVPNNKISGGKILSSKVPKKNNNVGQIFRSSANTVRTTKGALGDFYRRIKSKHGGSEAIVATAHKIARIFYVMVKEQQEYQPALLQKNTKEYYEQKLHKLKKNILYVENQIHALI
jgi:transposase